MNEVPHRPKWRRRVVQIVAALVLLALVVAGPNLVFYWKWLRPTQEMPAVAADRRDQWAAEPVNPSLSQALLATLVAGRDKVQAPSMSAAVGFDGQLQWAGAVGYADIENGKPATITSRYRLGSTSKAITGVLLASLVDAGKVDLDKPVGGYVADLPDHIQPLTARMLASHTAGVRHYSRWPTYWLGWHEAYSSHPYATVNDGLSLFVHDDLLFEPGTDFSYSTFGYSLLARLMEGATGEDFKQLLSDRVFEPAGMSGTAVDLAGPMPDRVSFYTTASGKYAAAYPTDASYKIAGGGIVSTPSDLVRLSLALLNGQLLSETATGLLWMPVKLPSGVPNRENYALGWRVGTAQEFPDAQSSTPIYHHGGVQEGGVCFLLLAPKYGIAAAVVANTGETAARIEVQNLAVELARLAAKRP